MLTARECHRLWVAPLRARKDYTVDIRIGIVNVGRELNFESSQSADEVRAIVNEALESKTPSVSFTDDKGNVFIVPTANIGYLELGTEESRRVGFVS